MIRDQQGGAPHIRGTRNSLYPLDLLATVTQHLRASHILHVVDGGDHSLIVRKTDLARLGKTQDDVDGEILAAVSSFVTDDERTNRGGA
jgi:uncharacterized protein